MTSPPATLNFLRWLIALLILAPFVARDVAASRHIIRREWRLLVALGATGIAAFHSMTYVALLYTTASNALLMLALVPVLILAGEDILNRECPSFAQIAGSLVSAVGAGVLITRGDLIATRNLTFNSGDLWMLGGIVVWAAYSLLLRRRPCDLAQPVALTASIVAALTMLAPIVAISTLIEPAPVVSARVVLGVGYVAVFASAIAFLCWSYGVTEIGAGRAGQFVHLMPIFGAALSVPLLGEAIHAAQIAGAALVAVGIALVNHGARSARPPMSQTGRVSRAEPVHTAAYNCTKDEGRPFGFDDQVADPKPPRELLRSKAVVVSAVEAGVPGGVGRL